MFAALALLVASASAQDSLMIPAATTGISVDRTISSIYDAKVHLTVDKGCTSSDAYGSNNCNWAYGTAINLDYSVSLSENISSGKIAINMKVDSVIPFVATCPACGANCTLTIPVVNIPVSFAMPPCPLNSFSISNITNVVLPSSNPIGTKTSASGTIVLTDQNGKTVLGLSLDATLYAN
jgi:hypothetical protein